MVLLDFEMGLGVLMMQLLALPLPAVMRDEIFTVVVLCSSTAVHGFIVKALCPEEVIRYFYTHARIHRISVLNYGGKG